MKQYMIDLVPAPGRGLVGAFEKKAKKEIYGEARDRLEKFIAENDLGAQVENIGAVTIFPVLPIVCTEEAAAKIQSANITGIRQLITLSGHPTLIAPIKKSEP